MNGWMDGAILLSATRATEGGREGGRGTADLALRARPLHQWPTKQMQIKIKMEQRLTAEAAAPRRQGVNSPHKSAAGMERNT